MLCMDHPFELSLGRAGHELVQNIRNSKLFGVARVSKVFERHSYKEGILEAGEACQNRGSPVVSTLCHFRVTQKRNVKMHFWESSRRQKHV